MTTWGDVARGQAVDNYNEAVSGSGVPPPVIDESSTAPPVIGVPDGYRPPGGWQQTPVPQYRDGDQFMGANRPPDEIANIQRSLAAARLLTGSFRIGVWDDVTSLAFEALLSYANQTGLDWQRALQQMITTPVDAQTWGGRAGVGTVDESGVLVNVDGSATGAGSGTGGGLEVQVSDPDSLRRTFRETAAAMRGQGFSDEQVETMVAAYQAVERRNQERNAAAATGSNTDELYETVATPSAQDWAEAEVRRRDPSGVMGRDVLDRMNQFMSMIGASAGTGQ